MDSATTRLLQRFARIARLEHSSTYLSWDQMVMMPPGGQRARADALAELASLAHALLVAPEATDDLARAEQDDTGDDALHTARLREMRARWTDATALPSALVSARVLAGATCEAGWRTQRPANDWAGFLVNFRPVVALAREAAQALREAKSLGSPYEAMMSLYCAGDDPVRVASLFAELKAALPPLLARVLARQRERGAPVRLPGPFAPAAQEPLGRELASRLGFDTERGRLDVSLHPFSTGSRGDLRITTRYREYDVFDALQAIAHEIGHASYEGGLPQAWADEPLGASRSMSVHESQSLFFEKHLFLSRDFQQAFAPAVHAALPALSGFTAQDLWRAQTGVGPSLIRVEADEVTYPLHVMLRHDVERALMDGELSADDVPQAWDDGMRTLLGIDTQGNYTDGCLQDIHWCDGSFGYFPSYTLGAINAAELAAALTRAQPRWREELAAGRSGAMTDIREWLATHVWSRASSVDAGTILRDAIGHDPDPAALLAHLERRYVDEAY